METFKKNFIIIFIFALVVAVFVIWYAVFYFERHQNLLVTFFDVGQGDAIFIEAPNGNQVLIDGGPDNRILSKLGETMPFWDRSVDLLILTHPHADHLDGLLEVLKRYNIGAVLESGVEYSLPEYKEWHDLLAVKKTPVFLARAGQEINAGSGVMIDVFSPFEKVGGKSTENPHNENIVSRLKYGSGSILLMGDAEKLIEYRLLFDNYIKLKSDVLKVGHHGSKTSSSEDFIKAVSSKIAIISVGRKNKYGHPYQEILERLKKFGINVLRTDIDGDIEFESDGRQFIKAD